jgi:hypothetical protein
MCAVQKKLIIPLTDTGRKCGYITWRKKHDADVKSIFGNSSYINLVFDNSCQENKAVDWERRRIGITWTLTRNLSKKVSAIVIEKQTASSWRVSFK